MNIFQHIVCSNCSNLKCYWNRRCIECNLVIVKTKNNRASFESQTLVLLHCMYDKNKTLNSLLLKPFECTSNVCNSSVSCFHQRCAQLTAGPMECVWVELAVVKRAGPARAVTSASATHSVSNTAPARMGSASVTRAGTESTAPLVSASVFTSARVEVSVSCASACPRVGEQRKIYLAAILHFVERI